MGNGKKGNCHVDLELGAPHTRTHTHTLTLTCVQAANVTGKRGKRLAMQDKELDIMKVGS